MSRVGSTSSFWEFRMWVPTINKYHGNNKKFSRGKCEKGRHLLLSFLNIESKESQYLSFAEAVATFSWIPLVHVHPTAPTLPGNNRALPLPQLPKSLQSRHHWSHSLNGKMEAQRLSDLFKVQYKQAKKPAGDKSLSNSPVNFQFPR